jgi:uncharacterized membrane protein
VLACCGVVLVVAAVTPLHRSRDVWSYAVLGRMVSEHGGNPYVDSPSDFADDPFLAEVEPPWRRGVTVYGPAFVVLATSVTTVTGTSPLATRVAFQSIAALAVGAALLLVDRRTRDPLAVALVGLNPAVALYTVGGGHNDALIGLGLLVAALVASRRPAVAGAALGLAALVKIVAVLALPGLVVWLWCRRDRAAAAVAAVSAAGTIALGYALVGGRHAVDALRSARDLVSWSSIWRPVQDRLVAGGQPLDETHLGRPALILVLALGALLVAAHRHDRAPSLAVAGALVAYVLGAAYTLVWYLAWVLPLLALDLRSRTTQLVLVYGALLLLAAEHPRGPSIDGLDRLLDHAVDLVRAYTVVALVLLGAGALVVLARDLTGRGRCSPPPGASTPPRARRARAG